jgi:hypothetical protein
MLGIAAIPALIQLMAIALIGPESPRWLVTVKQTEKAIAILKTVRPPTCNARREIEEIEENLKQESGTWRDLFSSSIRRALIVGMALQVTQYCKSSLTSFRLFNSFVVLTPPCIILLPFCKWLDIRIKLQLFGSVMQLLWQMLCLQLSLSF